MLLNDNKKGHGWKLTTESTRAQIAIIIIELGVSVSCLLQPAVVLKCLLCIEYQYTREYRYRYTTDTNTDTLGNNTMFEEKKIKIR